jgi:4-alpha-glucanotransferase
MTKPITPGGRRAGILLHITSLPGDSQTGELGREAYHFVDFLVESGMRVWQMLPVGPTQADNSPYQTTSVHAGNPALITLEPVLNQGWVDIDETSSLNKCEVLKKAWCGFKQTASEEEQNNLNRFIADQQYWLEDYALFQALHDEWCQPWWQWPDSLRACEPGALAEARARLCDEISYLRFEQYLFFSQWLALKSYANERGIELFGDMPIFVAHDSAEVWAQPQLFDLEEGGMPRVVAGVPPDYFSETGQRWGNPLYRWDVMQADGFSFWLDRLKTQHLLFDLLRIDHFRGFEAYWEIPAEEPNAINGRWVTAPGEALFERIKEVYGDKLPLVAEDLGIITPEVDALRQQFALLGMKIMQFAFSGESDNPYLPFNHTTDSVVYTGTHDNDTTLGWYTSLDDDTRCYVDEYLGRPKEVMPWPLIRCTLASIANLAIIPMQDLLALGGEHRMNMPGTTEGNWMWRFSWDQVEEDLAERIERRVAMYGRLISK